MNRLHTKTAVLLKLIPACLLMLVFAAITFAPSSADVHAQDVEDAPIVNLDEPDMYPPECMTEDPPGWCWYTGVGTNYTLNNILNSVIGTNIDAGSGEFNVAGPDTFPPKCYSEHPPEYCWYISWGANNTLRDILDRALDVDTGAGSRQLFPVGPDAFPPACDSEQPPEWCWYVSLGANYTLSDILNSTIGASGETGLGEFYIAGPDAFPPACDSEQPPDWCWYISLGANYALGELFNGIVGILEVSPDTRLGALYPAGPDTYPPECTSEDPPGWCQYINWGANLILGNSLNNAETGNINGASGRLYPVGPDTFPPECMSDSPPRWCLYIRQGAINALTDVLAEPIAASSGISFFGDVTMPMTVSSAPIASLCSEVSEIPQTECEALVSLFTETDGENWGDNEGWLKTTSPCTWTGVTCTDEHVYLLTLPSNKLTGAIPSELSELDNLTSLVLSNNKLTEAIPSELGQLTELAQLDLSHNELTEAIPSELSELDNLTSLVLSYNKLTEAIPSELGQLIQLTRLNLSNNLLTQAIPSELGELENLTSLDLGVNQLTGAIPLELGQLTELTRLDLYNNLLTQTIPSELGELENLTSLELGVNLLTGAIPSELGELENLTSLSLDNNHLTEAIPSELGELDNLTSLFLFNNQLTGAIPSELGQLTELTRLGLSDNQLTEAIPSELGELDNLTLLSLRINLLTGAIPSELGQLTELTRLDLSDNQLTEAIPSELGELENLTSLDLGDNLLTGAIPSELGQLTELAQLYLSNNELTQAIPPELGELENLTLLSLHTNLLTGAIPSELGELKNLTSLLLSYNEQLRGNIPTALCSSQLNGRLQISINGTAISPCAE